MLNNLQSHWQLVWYKAGCELRAEAAKRYLGVLWWIVEPLVYILAFYMVFAVGLRMGGDDYLAFLLCGLVPWKWFATTVQSGSTVIATNRGLMNQVYIHKVLLVCMLLAANLFKAAVILLLLLLALWIMGHGPGTSWTALPLVIFSQLVLIAGLASMAAAITPFLPDIKLIIDNGIMVLLFASGVFFDIASRPEEIQKLLYLNPVAELLTAYRDILLKGIWPNWSALAWVVAVGVLTAAVGFWMLNRFDRDYPKVML